MEVEISPELNALLKSLIGNERRKIYQQIGKKLPHTFRFNPLKGDIRDQQALFEEQGFRFFPLEGRENIFQITEQPYPIGKSLSHFLGHIYVQDIASMLPAIVLDPQPGDWILDLSAAPGSKTTQLGALMQNSGVLIANDIVGKRLRALGKNIERWGLCNTAIYRWYGEQFGNTYFQTFDRVLLDPACSGLGTLHKNPEILSWWTPAYCDRLSQTQQSLLISAIKSLRPGGVMTYSTCTLTPQENEAVIDFALQNYPVEVEEINLSGIKSWPGLTSYEGQHFHPDLSKTIRLYPFDRISEGFYVARLRKTDTMKAPSPERQKKPRKVGFLSRTTSPVKKYLDYLSGRFEIPDSILENFAYTLKNDIFFASKDFHQFLFYGKPLQVGLPLAHTMTQAAKLNTTGAQILGEFVQKHLVELDDLKTLEKFINRDGLDILVDNSGQFVVKYKECGIGYGIAENGRLKSQFPKAEWPFELSESE